VLEILGDRQKQLLRLLLQTKSGLTVNELAEKLKITRNAVRQHLAALGNSGLVAPGATRPSGGRPQHIYALTDKGKEAFPRHYAWFAQLMVESVLQESGAEGMGERLSAIGANVAEKLRSQYPALESRAEKVEKLTELMDQLGYDARGEAAADNAPAIAADNCVFHELAMKNPAICQFDLAMMSAFTDSRVDHQECMARGGNVCRFKFTAKI